MPTNTTNLGLTTYNATTDSQSKFLTFRNDTNGVNNSNMTKIDSWAGTVNSKIEELENQKPTILINATWISMGYYEATSSEIEEYKLDMLLTLRLDKDNDGTTTIKINSLPVKSLMKYGADGSLVNLEVGDLRIHHEYSFRYDGTSFVWQGGTSADQMNIVGDVGEIVTIGNDKTLETSGVALTDIAMKSQIKNNLTETETGNILDASQGKILDNKIGVLNGLTTTVKTDLVSAINENKANVDLKLVKTDVVNTTIQVETDGKALNAVQANPNVSGTLAQQLNVCLKKVDRSNVDLNTIFDTGTEGYCVNCINTPSTIKDGHFKDYYTPYPDNGYQEFCNWDNTGRYFRCRVMGIWQPWQKIATTTTFKTTASNLNNGWTAWGGSYYPIFTKNGEMVTVNCGALDSGLLTAGTIILSGVPSDFRPSKQRVASVSNTTNTNPCIVIKTDGTLVIDTSYGAAWSVGRYSFNFSYNL